MVNFTMLAFNRPRLTKQALSSLFPAKGMNVTIFNNGSDDFYGMDTETEANTAYWVTAFCAGEPNAWTFCGYDEKQGTGESRNLVISASEKAFGRGDYLYLSDNDVYFIPMSKLDGSRVSWLDVLINSYEFAWSLGFRVLGGYNHPYHQPTGSYPVPGEITAVREVMALSLQSMLMRWEVWDKYGPFNKTTPGRVCDSEDVEFCRKIHADGFKVGVVSPALIVNTGITNSFGQKIPGWELVKAQCPSGVLCE